MNDDLISRKMAIELILSGKVDDDSPEWVGVECPEECNSFLDWAAEEVGKMPSAERKKGRWIRHFLKNAKVPWGFDCSECGTWFVIGEDTAEGYNYCPNCGAEMRGEEECL